jgi:hypothetical protein
MDDQFKPESVIGMGQYMHHRPVAPQIEIVNISKGSDSAD